MRQTRLGDGFAPGDHTETPRDPLTTAELATVLSGELTSYDAVCEAVASVLTAFADAVVNEQVATTSGYREYSLFTVDCETETRMVRPINTTLFTFDAREFSEQAERLRDYLRRLPDADADHLAADYPEFVEGNAVNEVVYTMAQAIGVGLDITSDHGNTARKNAGMRFEDVVGLVLAEMGVTGERIVFDLPVPDTTHRFRCEADLVVSRDGEVRSSPSQYRTGELVLSLKTTSKDRMLKVFDEKQKLSAFTDTDVPVMGVFLHDVQRSGQDAVRSTFVADQFAINHHGVAELDGVYFLDPPRRATEPWFRDRIGTFDEFLTDLLAA